MSSKGISLKSNLLAELTFQQNTSDFYYLASLKKKK